MGFVYYLKNQKIPIKSWASIVDDNTLDQAINLANLPFAFHHIALMPDCHLGYGMPIGGVLATNDVVIPNAVGVDIGCGMIASKTNMNIKNINKEQLVKIINETKNKIPVGQNSHKTPRTWDGVYNAPDIKIVEDNINKTMIQVGTLGSGNHFIEFQKDSNDILWIMIHSGSRNFGYQIAKYYNNIAVELNQKWFSLVGKSQELAFLPLTTKEGAEYFEAMEYACKFALANRNSMMSIIQEILCDYKIDIEKPINIHHNYASIERHFGRNVVVHRKGATSAKKNEIGIIPGSQGTASYIVKGYGNPESFQSCSHGAGRVMGRKEAINSLNFEQEINNLERKGILHSIRIKSDLDEAPGAYKNIDEVIENQRDLVEIVTKLDPIAVIKG